MAILTGNITNPLGEIEVIEFRMTPLDSRFQLLKHLSSTSSISGSYNIELSEGYYHFDYRNSSDVWLSIGDAFISASVTASIQDIINTTDVILSPTVGATVTDCITDISGSVHCFVFENGLLKSLTVN
jgi:hypothetical protein